MYYPTLDEVRKLKRYGNLVPVYYEMMADLETPVSAYLKIARGDYSFLLESVEGGERLARYSFIGTEPSLILKTGGENPVDPLLLIEKEFQRFKQVPIAGLPRFHGGMVGYLSYEVARYFERLPSPERDPLGLPEAMLMLADTLLVFDHLTHKIKVVSHAHLDGDIEKAYAEATSKIDRLVERLRQPVPAEVLPAASAQSPVLPNLSQAEFEAMVSQAKEYIYAGDIIQVVLSQRLAKRTQASPFAIYRALRSINPSPYMYYLHLGDCHIVGASPELLVRVEEGIVSNHPIAGTRPRSKDPVQDLALEEELRHDEKECAEHIMLVDLGRNDIGRISEPGTVEVTQFMDIERYSHVMHLVSHVQGKLRRGLTQFDALRACFPAGTVSGAPKIRAMEIIAELEPDKRGPYAGAIGYFDFSGNLDTAIAIRTIVIKDGVAYVQAGGGIVADSIPQNEYQESLNKAQALLSAIEQAEANHAPVNR
ncbi:MAG TPA: anthranilate synthase component I [Dehalococcoidia bacterium]|jgi:anthranilate synthase component 1|nr:anthranilate synthase component I [Dehalococcoidia bacterium]